MQSLRSLNTDTRILLGSLVAIAILSAISVLNAPTPNPPSLSIRSDKPDGAMALQRWMQRSGYPVQEVLSLSRQLDDLDVLFILQPIITYSDGDRRLLYDWVAEGNTLVVTGSPFAVNQLISPYDIELDYSVLDTDALSAAAPTLIRPEFDQADVEFVYPISTERPDAVPHLFLSNLPVLMSVREQEGEIWVSGSPVSFTNVGIADEGNASIIANILTNLPPHSVIGFDEAAHGFGDEDALDFNGWLLGTPPGWGILLTVAITMLYLALRGRQFGRAVPLPDDRLRRESGEYIRAMATLFRRSGQRSEMLKHYDQQLRRRLSERHALDPKLAVNELVKTVVYQDPSIDETVLRELLHRLQQSNISEAELVRTVSDMDAFLQSLQ